MRELTPARSLYSAVLFSLLATALVSCGEVESPVEEDKWPPQSEWPYPYDPEKVKHMQKLADEGDETVERMLKWLLTDKTVPEYLEVLERLRREGISDENVKKLLREGAIPKSALLPQRTTTPLHEAVMSGDLENIASLLDSAADINAKDNWEYAPLHVALEESMDEAARLLVERGADVNLEGHNRRTPLVYAVRNLEISKQLIARGADVRARDSYGVTALWAAAGTNSIDVARLLIDHGADVNMPIFFPGGTPITMAAGQNFHSMVSFLIESGADVNMTDSFGATPLDHAMENDAHETARLLREHGARAGEKK